jgi:hypothetical protein
MSPDLRPLDKNTEEDLYDGIVPYFGLPEKKLTLDFHM